MRVLLGGFPEFPLFRELAIRLVRHEAIDALGIWSLGPVPQAAEYAESGIQVFCPQSRPIAPRGVSGALKIRRARQILRTAGHWDVLSLHYAHPQYALLTREMRQCADRVVTTLWGSDLYRTGSIGRILQARILRHSDAITVLHQEMADEVGARFGVPALRKTQAVRFGLSPLESLIKSVRSPRPDRSEFGLPDAPVISIGYNASPGQQHLRVLQTLERSNLPSTTGIVFPLMYGGSPDYTDRVIHAASTSRFQTSVIKSRLCPEEIARFRQLVDILIQVQPTDALSGSMQEHLYAGTRVITGSWLKYRILDERGIPVERVKDIDDIPSCVQRLLPELGRARPDLQSIRESIWDLSSWDTNLERWIGVFRG